MTAKHPALAWALFVILSIIWGSSFILIKKGLTALDPEEVAALRIASASLVLLPFAVSRIKQINKKNITSLILVGFMGSLLPAFFFALAQTKLPSALTGIMNALTPFFTIIISVLFFNVKLKYIGIALVAIDLVMIPYGNAGGRISHLGGAILGYIYAKNLSQGTDIGYYFEKLWQYIVSFPSKSHLKTVYKSKKKSSKGIKVDQREIDAILDKISNSGYESLTKNEKETLFNAGK